MLSLWVVAVVGFAFGIVADISLRGHRLSQRPAGRPVVRHFRRDRLTGTTRSQSAMAEAGVMERHLRARGAFRLGQVSVAIPVFLEISRLIRGQAALSTSRNRRVYLDSIFFHSRLNPLGRVSKMPDSISRDVPSTRLRSRTGDWSPGLQEDLRSVRRRG